MDFWSNRAFLQGGTVAQAVAPTTFGLDAHGVHGFESDPMSFLLFLLSLSPISSPLLSCPPLLSSPLLSSPSPPPLLSSPLFSSPLLCISPPSTAPAYPQRL